MLPLRLLELPFPPLRLPTPCCGTSRRALRR
jgi:hypothetical protein